MSRYIRLAVIFLLLQAGIFGILVAVNSPSRTYLAAYSDKETLLSTARSPRIVLIGGSSLAFGVDSELLNELLGGRYLPVNMGLHAGLGLEFQLNQALHGLRPGDVAVLSPEYDSLWIQKRSSSTYFSVLLQDASAWNYVADRDRSWLISRALLDDAPGLLAHDFATISWLRVEAGLRSVAGQAEDREVYSRKWFNKFGDNTGAWTLPSEYEFSPGPAISEPFPLKEVESRLSALRQFVESCRTRGVLVVYAYQPAPRPWYLENRVGIDRTADFLESQLPIPFLSDPAAELYEPEDFFDGHNHLRGDAVQKHTQNLARALLQVLEGAPE